MSDHDDLRSKIAQAKRQLPLPQLLSTLGLSEHAKESARCPFPGHEDKHPSFSVFKGKDGFWKWKCHSLCCAEGDEITFLSKWKGVSLREAISLYLDMAGFPRSRPPVSREYCVSAFPAFPASPESPESPESLVSPVSEGQGTEGDRDKQLRVLAVRNACTARKRAEKRRFKLARDLAAIEKRERRQLEISELTIAGREWYELSRPYLDPEDTFEDHLAALIAELGKVRVPTGEDALTKAIEKVAELSVSALPTIPRRPDAPESWCRLAALHRELSAANGSNIHVLSYHAAARAIGLIPQRVHDITRVLQRCGVIEIENNGKPGPNSRKAAEFRYLLAGAEEAELEL
jgi:hypothetical protein